jgi:hypothetical protein
MPMRRVLLMLSLTTGGCAGLNLDDVAPPQAPASPQPEGKRLAELVNDAFARAKLTGAPEVSTVRPAHDNQWGDWMFCIKSSSTDPSPKYAVLIGHDAILEVRSDVLIDGCTQETYHPLTPVGPRAKANAGNRDAKAGNPGGAR